LLIASVCILATAVVLTQPKEKTCIKKPATSGGASYDKKVQMEQAKKNSILRRFISYTPVKEIYDMP
jgi:hypothetical protein